MDHIMKKQPKFGPGYAWVTVQYLDMVFSPNKAIKAGTIFPELNITIDEYERGLYNGK